MASGLGESLGVLGSATSLGAAKETVSLTAGIFISGFGISIGASFGGDEINDDAAIIGTTIGATLVSALLGISEIQASEQNDAAAREAKVITAEAYVQSLSDEELIDTLTMIGDIEQERETKLSSNKQKII